MSSSNDFTTVKQLGQGCGGICILARRHADKRLYALKQLEMPVDHSEAAEVLQECHILASLEHPFIVKYFDSFVEVHKLYLVMDMIIHWGVFRYRRADVGAFGIVLLTALALDAIVLAAFTVMKLQSDPMIVLYAAVGMIAVFAFERVYLSQWVAPQVAPAPAHAHGD